MTSFGICASNTSEDALYYENGSLYRAAQKKYDEVILINSRHVIYKFVRGQAKPDLLYRGRNLSSLTTFLVRSTKNREDTIAILVRALKLCGCDVLDPINRFSSFKASKLLTTVERFQNQTGTDSYIGYIQSGAVDLLHDLNANGKFPLIAKPITGRHGQGIVVLDTLQDGLDYMDKFFAGEKFSLVPFFLQGFVTFVTEYRLFVVDGKAFGLVEKVKAEGKVAANASQGSLFVKADAPHIVAEALKYINPEGILGVDVAVDTKGDIHIIETNRAPQWKSFDKALGIDVGQMIIDRALERLQSVG